MTLAQIRIPARGDVVRHILGWAGAVALAGSGMNAAETPPEPSLTPTAHRELLLSGDDWQLVSSTPGQGSSRRAFAAGYPDADAISAIVPGDIHWDLERSGKVPPIFCGTNSQLIGWVAGKEWWYRKQFVTPAGWKGKRVALRFEGVDYLAEVWLNGQPLGQSRGSVHSV